MMKKPIALLLLSSFLVACGGGSSDKDDNGVVDGGQKPVTNPSQNTNTSRALAETATFGVIQAKSVREAPTIGPFSNLALANKTVLPKTQNPAPSPDSNSGVKELESKVCSNEDGSATAAIGTDGLSGAITYNNCNIGGGVIVSGKITYSLNESLTQFSMEYSDIVVREGDQVSQVDNMKISCSFSSAITESTAVTQSNCTYSSDYKDLNGISYRLESPTVEGNNSEGYSIYTEVINESYGTMNIASSGLLFNCDNNLPSSGTIDYSTKEHSARVTFPNCNEFTVTQDGVSQTYEWDFDSQ